MYETDYQDDDIYINYGSPTPPYTIDHSYSNILNHPYINQLYNEPYFYSVSKLRDNKYQSESRAIPYQYYSQHPVDIRSQPSNMSKSGGYVTNGNEGRTNHTNLPSNDVDVDAWTASDRNEVPRDVVSNGYDPIRNSSNTKRHKRRKILLSCLALLCVLIILAIILSVLFLIERKVDFSIQPVHIDNSTIDIDPNGFTLPVNPTIHTVNENFFDIDILLLKVQGTHPNYSNGLTPLGIGQLNHFTLEKRSEDDFLFPFQVSYNRTLDPNLLFFTSLLQNCTTADGSLYIDIWVNAQYSMWAKSDTIDEHRPVHVPCPISPEMASQILGFVGTFGGVSGGPSVIDM